MCDPRVIVISKMAGRSTTGRIGLRSALELIMQDGSDLEISDNDSEDNLSDSSDVFVPMDDDFGDDSDIMSDNESVGHDHVFDAPTDIDSDVEQPEAGAIPVIYDDDSDTEWMEDWTRSLVNFPVSAPFEGGSGLNLPENFEATPTPLDFYQLIVTPSVMKLFKTETNRYARTTCDEKKAAGGLSARSIFNTWTPVTLEEMNKFLAILVHMGLVKKPKIDDYWSTHPALSTTFASRLMTRCRFAAILAFFHLNDNARFIPRGRPDHDPLFKLRPLFDHLVQKFQQLYKPEEDICIDEAMCPWRGRSAFRCYMKDKPTKWGMKLYELCESVSGYVCNMEVMCHEPGVSNKPKEVCLRLLTPFANKGHTLFVDNYYCNPALADELVAENTALVGTVRANRIGLPRDLAKQQMQQGEMDYRRKNQLLYIHWKDKRDVHMLTTKHLPQMKRVGSRARPQNQKDKPECVVEYIHNMAGVDKSDQMISYLPLHRKTCKWWKKLAFHLLTLVMIQGHILCNKHKKEHQQKEMCLEDFVKSVCVSLAAQCTVDPAEDEAAALPLPQRPHLGAAVPPPNVMDRLRPGSHFPEEFASKPGSNAKLQRTCKVCYDRMKHRGASRDELKNRVPHTKYRCEQCQVNLCITPCFKMWHTMDKYHI
ncbi:piggyBac transposable element-derived protein 4-like [Littorina saxatilis]